MLYAVTTTDKPSSLTGGFTKIWDCSLYLRQYIEKLGLGASNFYGGLLYEYPNGDTTKARLIGRISYNGCIWDNDNKEQFQYYPIEYRKKIKEFRKKCGDL